MLTTQVAVVNTAGGNGAAAGGDGRFLAGYNNDSPALPTQQGTTLENFTGSRAANPFIAGGTNQTPYIPDLVDGAEIYGLTGLSVTSAAVQAELGTVLSGAPTGVIAAVYRMDVGPTNFNDNFTGFDALLYINLSSNAIGYPSLILGATSAPVALAQQGYARSTTFGGSGPSNLVTLGAYQIFMTLIPAGVTNAAFSGRSDTGPGTLAISSLTNGAARYLAKAPVTYAGISGPVGTNFNVTIDGVANQQYFLEAKQAITDAQWSVVATGTTDSIGDYLGQFGFGTNAQRFLRVTLP